MVDYDLGSGHIVNLCSAEDLIIHKAVVGRPQDLTDIESIIIRERRELDVAYIRRWLGEFSQILEMGEIIERFERLWEKVVREMQE